MHIYTHTQANTKICTGVRCFFAPLYSNQTLQGFHSQLWGAWMPPVLCGKWKASIDKHDSPQYSLLPGRPSSYLSPVWKWLCVFALFHVCPRNWFVSPVLRASTPTLKTSVTFTSALSKIVRSSRCSTSDQVGTMSCCINLRTSDAYIASWPLEGLSWVLLLRKTKHSTGLHSSCTIFPFQARLLRWLIRWKVD